MESALDRRRGKWDDPTMITTVDSKKRVVLKTAKPGDVFDVQSRGEKLFLLVRLERPEPARRMSKTQCLRAIANAPLHQKMSWEALRALTREP